MNGISVFTTFDAAVLEFDFECTDIDRVSFRYVFGSDEYNEWVNTNFNDPFGFFLNGANIALLPGGGGPVSVTNVSLVNNSAFFINNDITDFGIPTPHDVQADGFTVVLIAEAPINAGVNHIKLAIADAGDTILDSWVMIEGEVLTVEALAKTRHLKSRFQMTLRWKPQARAARQSHTTLRRPMQKMATCRMT